jgi:hypothetical protein
MNEAGGCGADRCRLDCGRQPRPLHVQSVPPALFLRPRPSTARRRLLAAIRPAERPGRSISISIAAPSTAIQPRSATARSHGAIRAIKAITRLIASPEILGWRFRQAPAAIFFMINASWTNKLVPTGIARKPERIGANIGVVSRMRCSAKRCTADPGSFQTQRLLRSRVCSAPLRFAPCCAAPGKRSYVSPYGPERR